ncbi:MAG: stalk domain-containing protein [Bacillota bacterium]|nr:stalk domain-containing protein [Bacillota bacterium]
MKRVIPFVVILSLIISTIVAAESSAKYKGYDIVKVNINDHVLNTDVPAIIMDGRTLLPLRKVAEAVNGIVSWDGATKTASITKPQINIMFTETKDGSTAAGEPAEVIPYWTEFDKYLSYISISGLSVGKHTLYCGIYKNDQNNNIDFTKPIDSKSEQDINVTGPNTPVIFALSWDKNNISEAGVYSFIVSLKDNDGNFKPAAIYTMELK